jgi:serine/threonine protein kinase
MDTAANLDIHDACPKYEDLVAFNSGSLPVQELEFVGAHLSRCAPCLFALKAAAAEEGSAVRAFRRSMRESTSNAFATDPEYQRMEERVNQLLAAEQGQYAHPQAGAVGGAAPPSIIGQYQIVAKIGQGGMGAVYRALHTRLKKPVAIKILLPDCTRDGRSVARFNREMEAVGRLDHHNIVRATDAGEANGVHFLVMELIDGMNLSRLVRLRGPLALADACELARQACTGLQCAHEHGLVHRDVKPSNLLLSVTGEVKVLDLGLALLNQNALGSSELTMSGQVMGTADYMAPEQWEASHAVDIRADVYSLGCTLYTLLVGRPPFSGEKYSSALKKMAAHAHERVPQVTSQRPDTPRPLVELLQRMTAKDPADRPATPAEVAKALEPFCQGADLAALARDTMAMPMPVANPDGPTAEAGATFPFQPVAAGPKVSAGLQPPRPRRYRLAACVAGFLGVLGVALVAFYQPWAGNPEHAPANPPQVPAGVRGPARQIDPAGWQNLLLKQPVKRFWVAGLDDVFDFQPENERLRIHSTKQVLVQLGETNAQAYKLQVGFRQTPWIGGIGVYFGGRPRPGPGAESFRCQVITLYPPDQKNNFRLVRLTASTVPKSPVDMPRLHTDEFAKSPLLSKPGNAEQLLEIEVRPFGLANVRWNGELCGDLVNKKVSEYAAQLDERGEFGIYNARGFVVVSTARYMAVD